VRVITFQGHAVKRQKKVGDDKILLTFYNRPPQCVTAAEWEAGRQHLFYDSSVAKRSAVVRSL